MIKTLSLWLKMKSAALPVHPVETSIFFPINNKTAGQNNFVKSLHAVLVKHTKTIGNDSSEGTELNDDRHIITSKR